VDPAGWPARAVDYVCGLRLRDVAVHELYGQTREEIRVFLAARSPSLAAMLQSLTAARAAAQGKRRWAEKTPRHLGDLRLIRRTFPEAAVIRVVRDPRDAAMSMTRVPFASDSLLANLYLCARTDAAAEPVIASDPRLLTVRYEDLVNDAEQEVRRITRFLGESFDARMLDPGRAPADLAAGHEWWKGKENEPLDRSRVEAWRREMSDEDQRIAAVVCHRMLRAHGYEGAITPHATVAIEPDARRFLTDQEATARSLALGGIVVRGLGTSGGPGRDVELAFWPLAGRDRWALGTSTRTRARALARMSVILGKRRLARRAAVWVRPQAVASGGGSAALDGGLATRVAEAMLRVLARPTTPAAWRATLTGGARTAARG
ncbi:MAG: sulfotransferase, partial [Chloroflexota bacterium]|nr:sulfotransferase [Chloroflexota bacterium]